MVSAQYTQQTAGYEYYGRLAKLRQEHPEIRPEDVYLRNHVWGDPKQCIEKLQMINDMMGADEFVAVFSYGGMPVEKAEKSMRLFAEQVLPSVQQFTPGRVPALVG